MIDQPCEKAEITMREIKKAYTYKDTNVLTLEIVYPEISLAGPSRAQQRINRSFRMQVLRFYHHAERSLYPSSVREYRDALENGFPFRPYDAVMHYAVTLNRDCHLSDYYDAYEYTGGAHGNTLRASDAFFLQNGRRLELMNLFPSGTDCRQKILSGILAQAESNMDENPNVYFADYRALILKYFNPESFFLTEEGIGIYFQQYQIAPYSTGIVVFLLTYASLDIGAPECDGQ